MFAHVAVAWRVALCCVALLNTCVYSFSLGDFRSPRIMYMETYDKCRFKESHFSASDSLSVIVEYQASAHGRLAVH